MIDMDHGLWEPDLSETKRGMAKGLIGSWLIGLLYVSIILILGGGGLTSLVAPGLLTLILLGVVYLAFLYNYRRELVYKRVRMDREFDEVVKTLISVLKEEDIHFRSDLYLDEELLARKASWLQRFNYSISPHFVRFDVEGTKLRFRVYEPGYRKIDACCIVLGPFAGPYVTLAERIRRIIDERFP